MHYKIPALIFYKLVFVTYETFSRNSFLYLTFSFGKNTFYIITLQGESTLAMQARKQVLVSGNFPPPRPFPGGGGGAAEIPLQLRCHFHYIIRKLNSCQQTKL
jgi:hypothetical protein